MKTQDTSRNLELRGESFNTAVCFLETRRRSISTPDTENPQRYPVPSRATYDIVIMGHALEELHRTIGRVHSRLEEHSPGPGKMTHLTRNKG